MMQTEMLLKFSSLLQLFSHSRSKRSHSPGRLSAWGAAPVVGTVSRRDTDVSVPALHICPAAATRSQKAFTSGAILNTSTALTT